MERRRHILRTKNDSTISICGRNEQRYLYLESIFNKYKNDLKRYLLKSLRHEAAADDLVQDVFVRLLRYKVDIPESSIKGFLFVTSANLVKDRFRRQKVRRLSLTDPNHPARLSVTQQNPEVILKDKQRLELLKTVLDDMDQKYHTAFILYRFQDKKHAEIAEIMGVTSRTVRNYIKEAMLQLNEKLQADT